MGFNSGFKGLTQTNQKKVKLNTPWLIDRTKNDT